MSIWWTQCLLVAQTNINEGAGKQTESQVVLFFIFFQTLITCLWIIIDGSQVNGLKTEIHPRPSYFQSSGDRRHILFISSARSSSVHHGLLHTYIQAHFIRFFKGAGVFERPGQTMKDLQSFGTSRPSNGLKSGP